VNRSIQEFFIAPPYYAATSAVNSTGINATAVSGAGDSGQKANCYYDPTIGKHLTAFIEFNDQYTKTFIGDGIDISNLDDADVDRDAILNEIKKQRAAELSPTVSTGRNLTKCSNSQLIFWVIE
jgi:hypothetical protein